MSHRQTCHELFHTVNNLSCQIGLLRNIPHKKKHVMSPRGKYQLPGQLLTITPEEHLSTTLCVLGDDEGIHVTLTIDPSIFFQSFQILVKFEI